MKIFYDHQIFSYQNYGGISRYHTELFNQFSQDNSISYTIGTRCNVNEYLSRHLAKFPNHSITTSRTENIYRKYFIYQKNKRKSIELLKNGDSDLIHPTFYDPYILNIQQDKPLLLTIHDMTTEHYPHLFMNGLYYQLVTKRWIDGKRRLTEKADGIIAISNCTKNDLVKYYGIDPGKIQVIYHGVNSLPVPESIDNLPSRYLLYVGDRRAYKNFHFFLNAVSQILEKEFLHVLCVGGGRFSPTEKRLITTLGIQDKVFQRFLTDGQLAFAYMNAEVFVYPSKYEGFGMPVLEAFSMGCPVILNNSSCFPEIGGDGCFYFDDNDDEQLCNVVENLLHDDNMRADIVERGFNRSKFFSWERCAATTKNMYQRIIEKS